MNEDKNSTDDMMMQMYFYTDCSATILFKTWKSTNCKELFGSCMIIIILAICYEGLRYIRNELNFWIKFRTRSLSSTVDVTNEEVRLLQPKHLFDRLTRRQQFGVIHVVLSVLYFIQVALGYFLMLVAMTFNAWLFLSICIGGGFGYLCFNFKKYLEKADEDPRKKMACDDESDVTHDDHH